VPQRGRCAARRLSKKYNVVVTETKIELKQTVFFDTNRARIKSVSFALLDDVAQAMKDNPTLKVEIQGHTDSQGNASFNLKLSQKRAESVRTYLIKKGVTSDSMVPKGYGKNVPIADNRTTAPRTRRRCLLPELELWSLSVSWARRSG
jgi:OOP family OmpA-OmpF porin